TESPRPRRGSARQEPSASARRMIQAGTAGRAAGPLASPSSGLASPSHVIDNYRLPQPELRKRNAHTPAGIDPYLERRAVISDHVRRSIGNTLNTYEGLALQPQSFEGWRLRT